MAALVDVYAPLVSTYFPADAVPAALCILQRQIELADSRDPASVITPVTSGQTSCGSAGGGAYGLFGIVDACWNPALVGPDATPFLPNEWEMVLDPNTNVWMASVVWSIAGWRPWATCQGCNLTNAPGVPPQSICNVPGEAVPYPRHPVSQGATDGGLPLLPLALGAVAALGLHALAMLEAEGRIR